VADRIELRGLRAVGLHGASPEERKQAQPFEVDVTIEVDLRSPGRSDDLDDTIDYAAVTEAVAHEITGPHAELLEHLADRIAAKVLDQTADRATSVTVTVRKLRPPVPYDLASAAVTITRP
jgi:dihydroneopterin aldolase